MNRVRRVFALLLLLCLVLSLQIVASAAAKDEYVVRLYIGAQGSYSGGSYGYKIVKRGDTCSLTDIFGAVTLPANSKYYVKSIRESGKEEDHELAITNVQKDQDYVVTYGIRRDTVKYRVHYVNANTGAELSNSPSQWFAANRDDIVYVAYVEYSGMQPDAYNRVAQLNDDSSIMTTDRDTFEFYFRYQPVPTPSSGTTTPTTTGGGTTVVPAAGGAAAGANAANTNNQNNQGVNNAANNNAGTNNTFPEVPYEIINEDNIPLAGPDFGDTGTVATPNAPKVIASNSRNRLPSWALVVAAALFLFLIALLYWYLLFYRKKKKYAGVYDEEEYDILGTDDDDF